MNGLSWWAVRIVALQPVADAAEGWHKANREVDVFRKESDNTPVSMPIRLDNGAMVVGCSKAKYRIDYGVLRG